MESDVHDRMHMFKNIDDEYENEKKSKSTRRFSLGNKRIEPSHDAKSSKVDYTKFVTVVQPNPKKPKPIARVTFTNNEMMSNDADTDSRNDTISVTSNDQNLDEKQTSQQQQQQQQQSDKYNISNVLKHIYALKYVQRNDENKTGASRQFWMPDDQVKECFECNDKFTTFRRRHHCRVCGQIFCSKCSDYEIPSHLIWPNSTGNIRACTFCWKFVAQMETGDLKHNTKSIKELMKRLSLSATSYSPFSQNNSETLDQLTKSSQLDSMLAAQVSYQSTSNLANMSSQSLSTPNQSFSNSPTLNASSSSASLKPNNSNTNIQQSAPVDDNNPFDITENKDYFKSQDVEMKQLIINNSLELRNLWVQVYHTSDGLQFQTRSINKFKKVNNCITGNELVEWLIKTKSVTRDQAIVIGQALCHGKWLECAYYNNQNINNNSINNHHLFYDDNSFYRPGSTALSCNRNDNIFEKKQVAQETEEGPEWIKELNKLITTSDDELVNNNMFTLNELETESKESNEDLDELKVLPMIKIEPTAKVVDDAPFLSNLTIITGGSSQLSSSPHTVVKAVSPKSTKTLNIVNDTLLELHKQLQIDLCRQLLKLKNLSMDWFDIIMPIVWKCVDLVKPDVKHDNDLMDIRNYIKIKKLLNVDKKETRIVNGLVFTKNVAHKEMKKNLTNPKILLLRSSIEYQRTDEKMCSLEPIFTAESQYLKNSCSKLLLRHNPEILIVERSVARIAQEIFLQSNVTLVLNVKSKIMEKLCRFLQADPMYSIDDLVRKPKLGICSKFYVDNYKMQSNRVKTLMFFEGTPTNLGCTVLLCGTSLNELSAIKSLTNFLIYAVYNSKLEHSFILDKYADFEVKKSLHDSLNEPEQFAEKLTHSKAVEVDNSNKTQNLNNNKKANDSESKTILIKKEISIDQSPLDEVSNKKQADDDFTCDNDLANNNSTSKTRKDSQLKLTICNKHSEKSSFNLSRNFKELLDDLILSCSPFIHHRAPFLINENTTDPLVKYLPETYMNYLKSNILLRDTVAASNRLSNDILVESTSVSTNEVSNENNQIHDFLLMHLTKSFDNEEFKKLYADYKSRGGIAATLNKPKRLYLSEAFTNGFDLSDPNETNIKSKNVIKEFQKQTSLYDCLDIFNRQHLALLFYSQCETSPVYPNICNRPRVINMKFYSENDMTLGSFLAKNCFRLGYKCNNELCNTLIVMHTRTFVHADSKITVRMSVVPSAAPLPSNSSTTLPSIASSPTPTSLNNASTSSPATSALTDDKQQHQQQQQKPQQQFSNLNVNDLILNTSFKSSTSAASETSTGVTANSSSSNLNVPAPSSALKSASSESLTRPISISQPEQPPQQQTIYDEFNIYMWSVCKICNKSTKKLAMSPDTWSFSFAKFLEITFYASDYYQFYNADDHPSHCCKHSLFQDHYQYFRFKNIVTVFSTSKISIRTLYLPIEVLRSNGFIRPRSEYIDEIKELFEKGLVLFSTLVERICTIKALNLGEKQTQKLDKFISEINNDQTLKHKIEKINLLLTNSASLNESILNSEIVVSESSLSKLNEIKINDSTSGEQVNYDLIEMLLIDLRKFIANSVSNWNNKMTDFFKKSTKSDEEINALAHDNFTAIQKHQNKEGKHGMSENLHESSTANLLNEPTTPRSSETTLGLLSQISNDEEHKTTPSTISIGKRFIANSFIANLIPSSVYQPLKVPFPEDEHYLLSSESTYYINDKNLSSIVAFSLSSKEYKEFQMNSSKTLQNKETSSQLNEIPDSESGSTASNASQQNKLHFEHQFHDSTTKFYCKTYYADLFSKLRKLIMPNEEEKYIHSLFRCMNWDAKGGKSNSQFRKTIDNRFVLKEMSKQELQSFLDFAPQYVQYITDSIQNKKATALAKILGAYQICLMKNTTISSKAVKMDVIVLENLFYGKKFSQVFDLKGSERNRMVNETNKQPEKDLVLLDENFLRWSFDNPIYIKPHSKYVLMKAIEADSQFLSSKFVMDYSLLCGFDQVNDELVVGIIDYLRVFTWDKKVETYLKTISGQGKMPTIVSPEVYRKRFINAIDRYFLAVPDQWYQDTIES